MNWSSFHQNWWQKHSSHNSLFSFHVNRLIQSTSKHLLHVYSRRCIVSFARVHLLSQHKNHLARESSWKLLTIQVPMTFMQWHSCVQHKETDHPSCCSPETQLRHLTSKNCVNMSLYIKWLFSKKIIELSKSHTFSGIIKSVSMKSWHILYFKKIRRLILSIKLLLIYLHLNLPPCLNSIYKMIHTLPSVCSRKCYNYKLSSHKCRAANHYYFLAVINLRLLSFSRKCQKMVKKKGSSSQFHSAQVDIFVLFFFQLIVHNPKIVSVQWC